jgi:glycosyltransferase involved in cell wall biosynthesis
MTARIIVNGKFLADPLTGVQRHAWEIITRLLAMQPAIKIAVPETIPIHPGYQPLDERWLLRWGTGTPHRWQQRVLPVYLRSQDLLWTPSSIGPITVRRQVLTIHDLSFLDHPEWFSTSYSLIYRWLMPWIMRRALHIFTSSNFSKQRIMQRLRIPAERITIVPSAVSNTIAHPAPQDDAEIEARYKLPQRYLLTLGSVEPRKNLARLLEAALLLRPDYPDLRVVLVGGQSGIYNQVHFPPAAEQILQPLGYVPDQHLHAIYRRAEVFVYPSLYEGFGIPPLEAMACGTPVITSNCTSLPEVVGDAALVVPPLDVQSIADAIRRVLEDSDLKRRLIDAGQRRAAQFSWDDSTRIVADVLQRLAA